MGLKAANRRNKRKLNQINRGNRKNEWLKKRFKDLKENTEVVVKQYPHYYQGWNEGDTKPRRTREYRTINLQAFSTAFECMIDAVTRGCVIYDFQFAEQIDREYFFKTVEKTESLVFHPGLPDSNKANEIINTGEMSLDLPYNTCSLEVYRNRMEFDWEWPFEVLCILYNEKPELDFSEAFVFIKMTNNPNDCHITPLRTCDYGIIYTNTLYPEEDWKWIDGIAKILCMHIKTGVEGIETEKRRMRIGNGKTKRLLKIKNVIHIVPKKYRNKLPPNYCAKKIEFSHAFLRRGHWRSLPNNETVGKDRIGKYCVKGRTWVNQAVVGGNEKEKKIVRKIRHVH